MSLIYKGQTIAGAGGSGGGGGVPKGTIVIWSGAEDAIPSGWAICDGTNGTPDLRDRFVVGAGTSYAVGATGGEAEHKLTIAELALHSHVLPGTGSDAAKSVTYSSTHAGYGTLNTEPTTNPVGGNKAHNNLPPYYALCYIMKITDGGSDTGSGGSSEEIYSTEETRIGTWIDGKPLYRRAFSGTTGSSTTSNATIADLSDVPIDAITLLRGTIVNKNNYRYPVPTQTSDGYVNLNVTDINALKITASSNLYTNRPCYAIIEYTKTTDEATS